MKATAQRKKTNSKLQGKPGPTPPAPRSCCSTAHTPSAFAALLFASSAQNIPTVLSPVISALKTLPLNNVFAHHGILHVCDRVQPVQQPVGKWLRGTTMPGVSLRPHGEPSVRPQAMAAAAVCLPWAGGEETTRFLCVLTPSGVTPSGMSIGVRIEREQRWTPHKCTSGVTGQSVPPQQQHRVQQPRAQRIDKPPSLRPRTLHIALTESQREKDHVSKCLPINTFFLERDNTMGIETLSRQARSVQCGLSCDLWRLHSWGIYVRKEENASPGYNQPKEIPKTRTHRVVRKGNIIHIDSLPSQP